MITATLPIDTAALVEVPARVVYRLATDADGPAIGVLFAACDYGDLGVDWHAARVAGWWLVADRGGELVGAVQICVAQPYAFMGDVVTLPDVRARGEDGAVRVAKMGHVALSLVAIALKLARDSGSQIALTMTNKPGVRRIIPRYGGVPLGDFTLFAKGIR